MIKFNNTYCGTFVEQIYCMGGVKGEQGLQNWLNLGLELCIERGIRVKRYKFIIGG